MKKGIGQAANPEKTYICESPKLFFYVNDGQVIKSLHGLIQALVLMSDETFSYHAGSKRNDFSTWIKDVFSENELASKVRLAKSRSEAKSAIDEFFESKVEEEIAKEKEELKEDKIDKASDKKNIDIERKRKQLRNYNLRELISYYIESIKLTFLGFSKSTHETNAFHLKKTFIGHMQESYRKISGLKKRGLDTVQCESYLDKIRHKIKELNKDSTEKNAIELVHLFYCLDDEIYAIRDKESALIATFRNRLEELKEEVSSLKKESKHVARCEYYIEMLPKKIKQFEATKIENAAIDVLHTFYLVEDAIKDAKKE